MPESEQELHHVDPNTQLSLSRRTSESFRTESSKSTAKSVKMVRFGGSDVFDDTIRSTPESDTSFISLMTAHVARSFKIVWRKLKKMKRKTERSLITFLMRCGY
jgi:hypothetical protein